MFFVSARVLGFKNVQTFKNSHVCGYVQIETRVGNVTRTILELTKRTIEI